MIATERRWVTCISAPGTCDKFAVCALLAHNPVLQDNDEVAEKRGVGGRVGGMRGRDEVAEKRGVGGWD